jgi:hypothetical protein
MTDGEISIESITSKGELYEAIRDECILVAEGNFESEGSEVAADIFCGSDKEAFLEDLGGFVEGTNRLFEDIRPEDPDDRATGFRSAVYLSEESAGQAELDIPRQLAIVEKFDGTRSWTSVRLEGPVEAHYHE